MMPAACSLRRRSAKMFVAIPSPDCSKSEKVRKPRTIKSRTIKSDQRSPKISREMLTGHPDLGLGLGRRGTGGENSKLTCDMQVKFGGVNCEAQMLVVGQFEF